MRLGAGGGGEIGLSGSVFWWRVGVRWGVALGRWGREGGEGCGRGGGGYVCVRFRVETGSRLAAEGVKSGVSGGVGWGEG